MNVDVSLEDLTQLNQILGLIKSPDFEAQVLGFNLFLSTNFYKDKLSNMTYTVKSGKDVPIYWFVDKCKTFIEKRVNNPEICDSYCSLYMICQIIESILLCEYKFKTRIMFNVDKQALMKHYFPEGVFKIYETVNVSDSGCQTSI